MDRIKSKLQEAGTATNNISVQMQALAANSSAQKLALESIEMAQRASEEMRAETRKALEMHDDILKLRQTFAMLEPDWEIKLGMAEENISLTKTNIRLANITLNYVEEQTMKSQRKFDEWNNTMSKQLQELRDKIAKAKHAAEGVSLYNFLRFWQIQIMVF